ncbi:inositol hexakisphosphate and diphosphoinositol-pentakisphosphate kinase [Coemansia sp. RSA 562]|nr:inositol hexakisphosphate and diphosphoinositol-pentakisphosphate kinase [Coemansia sp. RSA 1938]KAJ2164232.1 inositol hexakisphosphate and diphosphoinositol-pentakisphosphate kinase [Coemansia sp. RSA 562]KAJ2185115.1 inositol hexakisphosphate and diphosphoinositol-pentakisphosphate kinase [Coemansia sp. RSA 532]KAJ2249938.1 inositol hexakisphosphate and diphosphoinositol-pentakisphosphate kinase [Coemansia sp. RSA 475]KAJ2275542.1 inositol hexakisphosphate and diphosphoinositol-pentakispho
MDSPMSELGMQLSQSHFMDLPQFEGRTKPIIGICAMDSKARSKAMANILERLQATDRYAVVFFGEKTILDEDVEVWPVCDFLISFFSQGFPLEKALQYVQLRKPFSVNSLVRQFLLLDRRVVLEMLHHVGVPTPFHVVVSRDGGAKIHPLLQSVVEQRMGFRLGAESSTVSEVEELDPDTLRVGTRTIRKPFVEKPCDAEDHNIYIYYSQAQGGGVRRLFRKIGNKSSEFVPGPAHVRTEGSYIYEEFISVDNAVDVKVYTVGNSYAHAETRKSPVVDGHVRRNSEGKEMRFVTALTAEEREYARAVSKAFGQRVCGFDILRTHGKSMVMDVNGWSFVKGNDAYYDHTARILDARFQEALRRRWFARFVDPDTVGRATYESRWVLKGVFSVCRHADRTPKQKTKCVLQSPDVVALLDGSASEVTLRSPAELSRALDALDAAQQSPHADDPLARIVHVRDVLARKIAMPGTKVQLKPQRSPCGSVQLILKWGGECTHAGIVQSQDLGENMRKDLLLINRSLLDDVRMYSSAERRVLSTVAAYGASFLDDSSASFMDRVSVRADMLDDSTDAKDEMEVAKQQLRGFFDFSGPLADNPYSSPAMQLPPELAEQGPHEFLHEMYDIIARLIARMERNFARLSPAQLAQLQPDWCCNENADLFRERWKKILSSFKSDDSVVYDPAKAGELYDSLKYDALHNRCFLERIFMSSEDLERELLSDPDQQTSESEYPPDPLFSQQDVRTLYYKAKQLFDFVTRNEYGIEPEQRRKIGIQASVPLLRQLIQDLQAVRNESQARTCFYFTKKSHIYTLLNLVFLSNMPTMASYDKVGELDYLTHIIFEVYERKPDADADVQREYSVRIGFSPGANCFHVLDTNIDDTHALKVLPRKNFTHHIPLESAISMLQRLVEDDCVTEK